MARARMLTSSRTRSFGAALTGALAGAIPWLSACAPTGGDATETRTAAASSSATRREDFGACAACHLADYQGAPHHVGEKPTTCSVCHSNDGWHPPIEHHPWPLSGKHEKLTCFECHKADRATMKGLDAACVSCHAPAFEGAADHVGHFPTTCEQCHSTAAWKPILANAVFPPHTPTPSAEPSAPTASSSAPHAKPSAKPHPKPAPTGSGSKVDTTSNASRWKR